MVRVLIMAIFFALSQACFSQGIYKGGGGDGYSMSTFSNFQTTFLTLKNNAISISPSIISSKNRFFVLKGNFSQEFSVLIYNTTGELKYSRKYNHRASQTIYLNSFLPGLYFVEIRTESEYDRFKIIVF